MHGINQFSCYHKYNKVQYCCFWTENKKKSLPLLMLQFILPFMLLFLNLKTINEVSFSNFAFGVEGTVIFTVVELSTAAIKKIYVFLVILA
jgi:hypothetical protein